VTSPPFANSPHPENNMKKPLPTFENPHAAQGPTTQVDLAQQRALPLGSEVRILHGDTNGLLAFYKPPGVRSHPNSNRADAQALLLADYDAQHEAYHWHDHQGSLQQLFLINRLDAPTSGLLLGALSADTAAAVRTAFRERAVDKTYLARVFAQPQPASGCWQDRLQTYKTAEGLRSRLGTGTFARTRYKTMSTDKSNQIVTSVLELLPETGRTHQLRVQCQGHGVPVVGDQTYGDFQRNRQFFEGLGILPRLYLHAWRLQLSYQLNADTFTFMAEAPAPGDLIAAVPLATKTEATALNTRRFKRP
jgi:23S rRNA-/tRNA-specific pseudouridylate synthase